jgi:hypothetical protein
MTNYGKIGADPTGDTQDPYVSILPALETSINIKNYIG